MSGAAPRDKSSKWQRGGRDRTHPSCLLPKPSSQPLQERISVKVPYYSRHLAAYPLWWGFPPLPPQSENRFSNPWSPNLAMWLAFEQLANDNKLDTKKGLRMHRQRTSSGLLLGIILQSQEHT